MGKSNMSTDVLGVQGWTRPFEALCERIGGHFSRQDFRRRAEGYLHGLLGPMDRKNGWQLAEYVGDATPHGIIALRTVNVNGHKLSLAP